jgi:[amino group carrier protein]-L-2-aminoadipate 6-kinase
VLCPPGLSYESEIINVDGDRAAAVLAAACKAETLVILSNVPGLLRDVNDANSLVRRIDKAHISSYMDLALGRMKHKMMGTAEALEQGVGTVILGDARLEHPIQQALQGQGTVIR